MRAFLLFLSSLLTAFCFSIRANDAATIRFLADEVVAADVAASDVIADDADDDTAVAGDVSRYAFAIETPKAAVTGVAIMRADSTQIVGSLVNEFGVSAIDFIYNRKKDKVKLVNVVSFLNKWYIKLVLKNDIKLCLHVLYDIPYKPQKNYDIELSPEKIKVTNRKRKIIYSFSDLPQAPEYETEE